jgi:Glycosyltransferase family 87
MSTIAPSSLAASPAALEARARRLAFLALLGAAVLLPHLTSDGFEFPQVSNFWSLLPFCGLFLLPFLEVRSPPRMLHLDLLVLLSFVVALGCWENMRTWPVLLIYPPLIYLCLRMVFLAGVGRSAGERSHAPVRPRLLLGRSWLVAGIIVLAGLHVSWALEGRVSTDVAEGGVQGAQNIAHGRPLYSDPHLSAGSMDPHLDTYGPLNYEAYLPFTALATGHKAARLTTLFFDLLTALLLFMLGRQIRGPSVGVLLAFCWLAFPFTLYEEALGFNDSIVAATLVGTVLAARSPARRGAMAAAAAWTKLSPLALLPLLAGHQPGRRSAGRTALEFAVAFLLASGLIFLPAIAHSSLSAFLSRSFGFQSSRSASGSIWAELQGSYSVGLPWLDTASRVLHGLLVALTGAFAISLFRAPRRQDAVGLAAAAAAVLIAIEACLGYYSFSYILWFAPLVLIAVILGDSEPQGDGRALA